MARGEEIVTTTAVKTRWRSIREQNFSVGGGRKEGNKFGDNRDDSPTRCVHEIPAGDRNREVAIEARSDGLWIDEYIVISCDWIDPASRALLAHREGAEAKE